MKMRRFLAVFLAVVMLVSMLPAGVSAATVDLGKPGVTSGPYDTGKLYLDKTATLEDDGTYTIRMEAFATGTPVTTEIITGKPLDIVLVIDQSGSIIDNAYLTDLRNAVESFISAVADNGKTIGKTHRIAVAGFASARIEDVITCSINTSATHGADRYVWAEGSSYDYWTNTGIYLSDGSFKNYESIELVPISSSQLSSSNATTRYTGTGSSYLSALPNYYADVDADRDGELDGLPRPLKYVSSASTNNRWQFDKRNSGAPTEYVSSYSLVQYYQRVSKPSGQEFTGLTVEDYQNTLMPVTDGAAGEGNVTQALKDIAGSLSASGATRPATGMELAYNILINNPLTEADIAEGRERMVVVFTDGQPGRASFEADEADRALAEAAKVKSEFSAEVYAIGLHSSSFNLDPEGDIAIFMNGLSSNYPNAESMDDVYGSVTKETYTRSNLSLSSYRNTYNTWQTTNRYALVDGVYEPIQVYVTRSRSGLSYTYTWQFRSLTTNTPLDYLTVSNKDSSSAAVNNQQTFSRSQSSTSQYLPGGTPAMDGGKYYREADSANNLRDMFPTIVTESTSTKLEYQYLTKGSILRDILGTGFVLTNNTTITATTLEGTWNGAAGATTGTITWNRNEEPHATMQLGGENAIETLGKQNIEDPIQVYNTNPAPDGNFYRQDNLTAPHTVDVTGFDYNEEYFGVKNPTGVQDRTGKKLIVEITGIEAVVNPEAVSGAISYDRQNMTNHEQSGLWAAINQETGVRELVATFPIPNTYFTNATYVMDYAKPMTVKLDDLSMKFADSLDVDGMNYFKPANEELDLEYGLVEIEDRTLVYKPTTTKWDGYDTFYVFGEAAEDSYIRNYNANSNGNLWGKVNVIPANNVYYEDTFVSSNDGATVGIVFGGNWTFEQGENAGENTESGEDEAFGGVHGWEDALADDNGYSDGSVAYASAGGATATFTFTGTGVDIYSYTDMKSGAVMANIYAGESATGTPLYSLMMDNFALSGGYYQIPTLALHQKYLKDEAGKNVKDEAGNNLYEDLGYGTYTVKLTVVPKNDDADGDGVKTTRSTYHLDGIRIYNPIQNIEDDEVVKDAYGQEELNASFFEIRDILLTAETFDPEGLAGPVFIDQIPDFDGEMDDTDGYVTSDLLGVFAEYGPKNEVYLSARQSIAFNIGGNSENHYYVALKSPTGEEVKALVSRLNANGVVTESTITLDHTTDLYYEVTPEDGYVMITNNGGALLSITKIKVTGPDISDPDGNIAPASYFEPVEAPVVMRMLRAAYTEEDDSEDVIEPEIPADPEQPEPTVPDVEIENPTEPGEGGSQGSGNGHGSSIGTLIRVVKGIFDLIRDWFG